ncbi:MAG: EamA family transporter [Rhodospirillales bacterium]|nr:EamA family transporter [Rhodospirillales bacterium]
MRGLFVAMCLIWGTTWLAMKVGVASVPPVFFAGTRFVVAGLVLLLLAWARGETRRLARREWGRLALVQLLMVVLTYATLFWGIVHVPSGLTAVLDLALTPVCLLGFGIALGEEHWSLSRAAALGFGFVGLAVLFGPQIAAPTDLFGLLGAAAIVFSAVAYSLGSVMARPLTRSTSATFLSGITLLPGGLILTMGALALEPGAPEAAQFHWGWAAWGGWSFLVVFGSLIAFTAYLRLIAAWGAARAGSYAYVSPVIAVIIGVLVLGEPIGWRAGLGMALLLAAAFCSLQAAGPNVRRRAQGAVRARAAGPG